MTKPDKTVLKETGYIALWVAVLSALMQAVFLLIGRWDYRVLLGNLLSAAAVIGNFLLMGITVQRAVEKEEKAAAATMKFSQSLRLFLLFGVAALGVLLPVFNTPAVLIPFFFPRIALIFRPRFGGLEPVPSQENGYANDSDDDDEDDI